LRRIRRGHVIAVCCGLVLAGIAVAVTVRPSPPAVGCHIVQQALPDPACTPGETNPAVTQANIQQTICISGYTKTIRPPASYTDQLKLKQIKQYGYTDTNPTHYEEDHLIALELGGSPTSERNLWPEPRFGPHPAAEKDLLENRLHAYVCAGKLTLAAAQHMIATSWVTAQP
jgi:hypothetical protein